MAAVAFDGWETQFYGDCLPNDYGGQDYLMHFRTRGSKNGVRRFQNPDGTWTPLGLRERKEREGWGEGRAARKEARAQRRNERRAAKAAERSERAERLAKYKAEKAEAKRKRNIKNLTDEELRTGINRLKMEQEYRELAKSPLLKTGEKLVGKYMDYRISKLEEKNKQEERAFKYFQIKSTTENVKRQSEANKIKAKADIAKAKAEVVDIKKGTRRLKLKNDASELKYKTKELKSNTTILGGLKKFANKKLSGMGDYKSAFLAGKAKVDSTLYEKRENDKYADQQAAKVASQQKKQQQATDRAARKVANKQKRITRKQNRLQRKYDRMYGKSGGWLNNP